MPDKNLTKMLFETVVVLAIGLIAFMILSAYNMHVIDQQAEVIKACGGLK